MMTRKDILGVKTDFGSKEEKNRKEQRQSQTNKGSPWYFMIRVHVINQSVDVIKSLITHVTKINILRDKEKYNKNRERKHCNAPCWPKDSTTSDYGSTHHINFSQKQVEDWPCPSDVFDFITKLIDTLHISQYITSSYFCGHSKTII